MIPDTDSTTGYLPPGVHIAAWGEVVRCFASNITAGVLFRDLFQTDRDGVKKGVVLVDLRSLP